MHQFDRLRNSQFVKSVLHVSFGTAGAQMVALLATPFITRIYGPEAFGVMGIFLAYFGVLATVTALAYPTAIVLSESKEEVAGLIQISILSSLFFSILIFALIYTFGDWLIIFLDGGLEIKYMLILPVALLSMTLFQIQYQLLIKSNNFKAISGGVFFGSVASNSLKVLLGVLFPAAITLVVVTALSNLFGWIALKYKSGIHQSGFGVFLGWKKLKSITIKYKDFPIFRAPQDLINAFSQSLPVVLLGMYFGVEAAGFYALAKLIIGAPSQLIGKAVGDVFYPKITQAFNVGGDAYQLLVKATKILIILGVFPLLLISLFGQEIFKYLFGDGWYQAGIYAQWLSVFYFFNLINKPAVAAVPVLGIQKGLLIYEIASTSMKFVALYIGFKIFNDDVVAVALYSIFGAASYAVMILWILHKSSLIKKSNYV